MSNTILHPPGAAQPALSTAVGHVHGGVTVDGVSLNMFYTSDALTQVVVGSTGDGNHRSWLGWAATAEPVTKADVREVGARLGRELLAAMNSEVLCVGAIEELRRRFFAAQAESRAHKAAGRTELAAACDGEASALSGILPLLCVLADRIVPGSADKAHELQRQRNAAEPPMTFAEGVAATVGAIVDAFGDRAKLAVVVMGASEGSPSVDQPTALS